MQLICPTRQKSLRGHICACPAPFEKIFLFYRIQIAPIFTPFRPREGRCATSRNAGRDAVDAGSAGDERCESGRQSRVVLAPRRRCQVGGGNFTGDGDKKADLRGEHEAAVNTIACGNAGFSGGLVVTNSCAFYILHARLRVHWVPGIPHALIWADDLQDSGEIASRECGSVFCRHCERSEAIQLSLRSSGEMDCFASLAMTDLRQFTASEAYSPAVSDRRAPIPHRIRSATSRAVLRHNRRWSPGSFR